MPSCPTPSRANLSPYKAPLPSSGKRRLSRTWSDMVMTDGTNLAKLSHMDIKRQEVKNYFSSCLLICLMLFCCLKLRDKVSTWCTVSHMATWNVKKTLRKFAPNHPLLQLVSPVSTVSSVSSLAFGSSQA